MAQTYTLEEAAQRLGVTPEAMKRRLKEDWKTVRSFRDGPTLRFRAPDIDELARSLGEMSDPSLQLAPLEQMPDPPTTGDFHLPELSPPPPAKKVEEPILFGDDDLFALPVEEPASGRKLKVGDSDSDVRLDNKKPKPASHGEPASVATEEVDLDLAGPGSAIIREGSAARLAGPKSSTKLSASDSNNNLSPAGLGDSSEFDLSLDGGSDDFELQLNADSGADEVPLGVMPKGRGKRPGDSGINLRDPVDSGINLEKKGGMSSARLGKASKPDSDLDFELSLEPPLGGSAAKLGGPRTGKLPPVTASDSEFELTLDDPSTGSDSLMAAALPAGGEKNDIFETDFEIPPLEAQDESGSEALAVEDTDLETSDFDLALDAGDVAAEDESASQVVLLEDEVEVPQPPTNRKRGAAAKRDPDEVEADVDYVEEDSAAGALAGVKPRSRFDGDEELDEDEEDDGAPAASSAPAPWGVVPLLFLAPAFAIMLMGGLMGYELLQSMWGYHQPRRPAAPIVHGVANIFEMDVKDQ